MGGMGDRAVTAAELEQAIADLINRAWAAGLTGTEIAAAFEQALRDRYFQARVIP